MRIRNICAPAALVGLVLLLAWSPVAQTQEATGQDNGVEVLARGPVHEAYAEPTSQRPTASPVVPRQPPEPIAELPPDQKPEGDNVQWMSGYWSWDDDRSDFIWISGFWRVPPPNEQWVPGHWGAANGGWQWTPGFWTVAGQNEVQYLPPPPEPLEAAASVPAPEPTSVFVPGVWVWRDRYFWRPGYWIGYRLGWVWIPAHYAWTPCGYVFVDGHWDYPLRARGLLFAPIYVARGVYSQPDWYYTPRYVVQTDFLFGSLFVRADFGHYYFGDYFDPRYERRGFVPWIDYRIGRVGYDPLYAYYRHRFAEDRNWDRDMRSLYAARFRGDAPRPPQTLVQQTQIVNNITRNNVTNVTNVKNVTVLAPLTQANQNNSVKLTRISQDERLREQKGAQQLHQVAIQRGQVERQMLSKGFAVTKATDKPQAVKLDMPKVAVPHSATGASVKTPPPPPPMAPKAETPHTPMRTDPPLPPVSPKKETTPMPPAPLPKPPVKEPPPMPPVTKPPVKDGPPMPPVTPKKDVIPPTPPPVTPKKDVIPPTPPPMPPVTPKRDVTPPMPPPIPPRTPPPSPPPPPPRKEKDKDTPPIPPKKDGKVLRRIT